MKTNLGDHRQQESPEEADLISLFFALIGAGFIVFAAAFNEFLLRYLDPRPPLSTEVIATVRTGQLQTLIIGLVLIGASVVVNRVPRLNVLVRRGALANVIVGLLLTVSAVVAMELVLRPLASFYRADIPDMYVEDAELGWRLRPGTDWQRRSQQIHVNSHGLRGPEVAYAKPDGVIRVLFLGGSVTFGLGLRSYRQTFAYGTERIVGCASGREVEAINAGVPGYATWQQYSYLVHEGVWYDPDVVVLAFAPYDVVEWLRLRRFGGVDDGEVILRTSAGFPLANRSAIAYLVWKLWVSVRFDGNPERLAALKDIYDAHFLCNDEGNPTQERGWTGTVEYIKGIHEECRSRGMSFAVIMLPTLYQMRSEGRCERPQARLAAFAARNGIPALDLLPALREAVTERGLSYGDLYLPGEDAHFSALGTEIIAEATAEFLRSHDIRSLPRRK